MRAAWVIAVIALLGACFTRPSPFAGSDAGDGEPDAPDCSGTPFPEPTRIAQFDGNVEAEPTISGDLLAIYFINLTASSYSIRYGDRSTTMDDFAIHPTVTFEGPGVERQDPSISTDGKLLVFRADHGMGTQAFFVERTGGMWSTPEPVRGFLDEIMTLDLRGDGLEIYFNDSSNQLHRATRPDRSADFVYGGALASDFLNPTVSNDGLDVYYTGIGGTWHSHRTALDQIWLPGTLMFVDVFDPDITADGQTMVFKNSTGGVSISQRDCP